MATQQQSLISVAVDGRPLGTFDNRTGGEESAEPGKHRPGGMVGEKSYGALPTYGDLTVGRVRENERDIELERSLTGRSGRARMTVSEQPLDENGAPFGRPKTWTGRLKGINSGEVNSGSGDVRMWELVMLVEDLA